VSFVGANVSFVGADVGAPVGASLGLVVGALVGPNVAPGGKTVGDDVGCDEGAEVGKDVGCHVGTTTYVCWPVIVTLPPVVGRFRTVATFAMTVADTVAWLATSEVWTDVTLTFGCDGMIFTCTWTDPAAKVTVQSLL
jgi:hypothetical protein